MKADVLSEHEMNHQRMALWAADCAAHVLAIFETRHPEDVRPREAIHAARGWARETVSMRQAHEAALAAYAAARETGHLAAAQAARAAAHAAESAQAMEHARHAAAYAITAATRAAESGGDPAAAAIAERNWQYRDLHKRIGPSESPPDAGRARTPSPKQPAPRKRRTAGRKP
ncbi:MAG: hypothetical protein KBA51_01055 [Kiritimatiellae bacterium]|nr:hypothetical protein [Kiritimatiellia bacterium]